MKLHYKEYNHGLQSLVILHGLLGSAQNWHSVARQLSDNLHVVVPDLRNHGESPHGPHRLELMRDDVLQLLDALNLHRVILMGHSMGGVVAMSFAFTYPQWLKALIVVDIAPDVSINGMEEIFIALESLDLNQITSRQQADELLAQKIPSTMVRQFLLQNLKRRDNGSFTWRCNLPELHRYVQSRSHFQFDEQEFYSGPTLFIGGEKSPYRLHEKQHLIARHFSNYHLVMIPGAGHWVHFEARQSFLQAVRDFITSLS